MISRQGRPGADADPSRNMLMKKAQKSASAVTTSRGRSLPWPLFVVVLAAGALVAVTVLRILPGQPDTHATPNDDARRHFATASGGSGGVTADAVRLLERIATVAASKPTPTVHGDQYEYRVIKAAVASQVEGKSSIQLGKPRLRQMWLSVDGSRPGLMREPEVLADSEPLGPNLSPSMNQPTYRYLASLPTDPDTLLKKIHAETKGISPSADEGAFVAIGNVLQTLVPPKACAALYRAAAKIVGVTVKTDAVDAIGRRGVAVTYLQAGGERIEWIFDKDKLEFLGVRNVMTRNTPWGKAGQVTVATAMLTRMIVDKAGQVPHRSS
ncbi:CU044_5270 family protein [Streptomyces sp. NPDC002730]|uniref:CU044_5270 family protein n=1 Tax=Streptomyces sp. NPDC002730 TaxID=3364662 RepID=UPI0036871FF6